MVQDESEIYPCRSELGTLSRRPTRAEPRRSPLFLGTARPPNACVPARIDRWRSCRPTFAGGTPASEGRAVPRTPTPGSGAVPKTSAAPVRPNPVRPREPVPQRETTLVGAASVGTALQLDPPTGSPLSPFGPGRSRPCSTDGDFARFDALDRTDLLRQTRTRPEMPGGRESSRKSPGGGPEPVATGPRARSFPLVPEVAAAPSVHRPARRP